MSTDLLAPARSARALVQQLCGIVDKIGDTPQRDARLPALVGSFAQTGRLSVSYPAEAGLRTASWADIISEGCALDTNKASSNTRALFEALERYASSVFVKDEVVTASQKELGSAAMDLAIVPRCSVNEYSDPKCPLRPADPSKPIRWVKAVTLGTGRECYVPLVMSHLYVRANKHEYFWNQISTGVAAHTDLGTAIVSAILEVVERDAIALTWLTQLPLAEILPGGGQAMRLLTLAQRSGCRFELFDASTDVGIPTIYGVQRRPYHGSLAQLVACASGFDADSAYRKTLYELAQLNYVDWESHVPPEDPRDITSLEEGATYMARPERAPAFNFLSAGFQTRKLEHISSPEPLGDKDRIADLRNRLARIGCEVYLVNLTTDDLSQAGVHVVRAIVPGLLPMSPMYRARYLGHPRLYDYARHRGLTDFSERDVTLYPQPFA